MRILILSLNYFPELTGIGKYSGEMAAWFSTNNHKVHVVTAPPYYPEWKIHSNYRGFLYKKEKLDEVDIYRCPIWVPHAPSSLKRILHLFSFAISSFPVVFSHAFWKPDVIITIEPPVFTMPSSLLVALMCRAKTILHIQDFEVDAAFELGMIKSSFLRKIISSIEGFFMSRFSRVSSISPNMVKRAIEKGINVNDAILFPNWVDTKKIYPFKNKSSFYEKFDIPEDKVITLYSGNMGEKQGLEIIIESARRLKNNTNIQFVMCGSGAAYKRLRKLADDLDNIIWLPLQPLEKLNDLLNFGDIHLLPQSENVADLVMPSKLTGIVASGGAVVATALKGTQLAEVVEKVGLVTTPGDGNEFTNAISELVCNSDKREKFEEAARQYAVSNLDINAVMSNFESDLLNVINGK